VNSVMCFPVSYQARYLKKDSGWLVVRSSKILTHLRGTSLSRDRGPVAGCCEGGNEPSSFIKSSEIFEWVRNWWFLEKGSAD
jgi:hypothetical protein